MITTKIVFESVLKNIQDITERNKAFDKLSREGKRKEIAWECLQLVITGQVGQAYGTYWSQSLHELADSCRTAKQLQKKLINELPDNCQVCLRGGMMLAMIRLGNRIEPTDEHRDDGTDRTDRIKGNLQGFSEIDMITMENEYESSTYLHPYSHNSFEKIANICCNVLTNGNFNREDRTNYLDL